MKTKLLILFACLFISKIGKAQTEYVSSKEVFAYEGKSYIATNYVILHPGFSFAATGSQSFSVTISNLSMPNLVQEISSPAYIETQLTRLPGVKTEADLFALTNEQKIVSRKYIDGLGRDLQNIYIGAGNSSKNDIVSFNEYDATGNISVNFLPYAANTQRQYQSTALTDQSSFYSIMNTNGKYAKDNAPFANVIYENSPIQRVLEESSYGMNWQSSTGKVKHYVSRTNTLADNVRLFRSDGSSSSYYSAGSLKVSEVTDEEGRKMIVFTDSKDNTILKRQLLDETISGQYHQFKETYYVYDLSGLICEVIPPKVVAELKNNNWILSANHQDNNIFRFVYDTEGHLIKRKVPSADWIYIVYDKLDRPVLVQDGRQRAANKWYFTKYDMLNRKIMEGLLQDNSNTSYENMKAVVDGFDYNNSAVPFSEGRGSDLEGYTNITFPTNINNSNLLSVYYYDSYDIDNNSIADFSYVAQGIGSDEPRLSSGQGQLTVTKSRIVGTSNWLQKAFFYDHEVRVVQQQSNNSIQLSALDATTLVYNFDGTLKKKIAKKNTGIEQKVTEEFAYDATSRLKEVTHQVNSNPVVTIASYNFNEIGQLTDKNLGKISSNNWLQSLDYRYNIRGWLTHINNPTLTADGYNEENNDVFGMELLYENQGDIGNTAIYNGQVSGIKWRAKMANHDFDNLERAYTYSYDKIGQIRNALFKAKQGSSWNLMVDAFSEKDIQYDLTGNITSLRRYMWNNNTNATLEIDHLSYNYDSQKNDQLAKVDDSEGHAGGYGFKDLSTESKEYEFDNDGNLTRDKNKGIDISYNEIGKVKRISYIADPAKYIEFEYSSLGERIEKSIYQNSSLIKRVNYLDGFVYENAALVSIAQPEGRVRISGSNIKYEYAIKDQLGNVKVSFEENGGGQAEVRQESSYYAFGLQHAPVSKPGNPNTSLFNGGSDWLADFDNDPDFYSTPNREYDPILGRFNGIDPLAHSFESWSPYAFSFNNPILYTDPSGASPESDELLELLYAAYDKLTEGSGAEISLDESGKWNVRRFQVPQADGFKWGESGLTYLQVIQWHKESNGKPTTNDGVSGTGYFLRLPELKKEKSKESKPSESLASRIWNSTPARMIVPDIININFNMTAVVLMGRGYNMSINLITRGRDAGFHGLETTSRRMGFHFDVSMNASAGWYVGDPRNASSESLLGAGGDVSADGEFFGVGLWNSFRDDNTPSWFGYGVGFGPGVGISSGITNTTRR